MILVLRCEIVSIHPTQAYMWVMNISLEMAQLVCHSILPDIVLISCPCGITASLSPLPELQPWACKCGFWQYYAECLRCERIPQSFSAIFAQPITSSLSAVPQPTHARMRYCYRINAHIFESRPRTRQHEKNIPTTQMYATILTI